MTTPDAQLIRSTLASYPTGVVLVTAIARDGEPVGMVVGTFSGVSLEPPLVAFMPRRDSSTYVRMQDCDQFCINILAADQEDLCRESARPGGADFSSIDWRPAPKGSPIVKGAIGWIECRFDARHVAGDHYIVVGGIEDLEVERPSLPLLFFQRGYGSFEHGSLMLSEGAVPMSTLRSVEPARREVEALAADLGVECSIQCRVDQELVIVLSCNHAEQRAPSRLGFSAPFAPPLGMLLLLDAAGSLEEEQWLARLGPDRGALESQVRTRLARVRERGWSMTLWGEAGSRHLDEFVSEYSESSRTPEQQEAFRDVIRAMLSSHEPPLPGPGETCDLLQVSVPVRGSDGRVEQVLRLGSLPAGASRDDVCWWVSRAQQTARMIGSSTSPGLEEVERT